MPSIGSRPEGLKYGEKTYFGYSGRHQVYMNFQPSPPSPHVATPAKVSTAAQQKLFVNCDFCLCSLLLWQKSMLYTNNTNISTIIINIIIIITITKVFEVTRQEHALQFAKWRRPRG